MKNYRTISLKAPAIYGVIAACANLPLSGYSFRAAVWIFAVTAYVVFMARLFLAFRRHHATAAWGIELFAHIFAFVLMAATFYFLGKCAERFFLEPSAYFEITVLYGVILGIVLSMIALLLLFAVRCLCTRYREKLAV